MPRSLCRNVFLGCAISLLFGFHAFAASLDGAWATDADACSKIFAKKNHKIVFTNDADLYGSGIIISGNKLQGKLGACHVVSRHVQGANVNISATCATDIAFSALSIILRADDNNTITRLFPSMPGMELPDAHLLNRLNSLVWRFAPIIRVSRGTGRVYS